MSEQEIKDLIEKKISHYRAMFKHTKDDFGAGAIEALESLLHEIEEIDEVR